MEVSGGSHWIPRGTVIVSVSGENFQLCSGRVSCVASINGFAEECLVAIAIVSGAWIRSTTTGKKGNIGALKGYCQPASAGGLAISRADVSIASACVPPH
jgi:hypothetical protein